MNTEEIPPRPLERLFHSTCARVLDFFIMNQKFDYSYSDISKLASVPTRTLQRILPILLEEELIIKTRKSGKALMYIFNQNSEKGKALEFYFNATLKKDLNFLNNPNEEKIDKILSKQITVE
jgi:hypothetical protein